jgi:hypothetical protein
LWSSKCKLAYKKAYTGKLQQKEWDKRRKYIYLPEI